MTSATPPVAERPSSSIKPLLKVLGALVLGIVWLLTVWMVAGFLGLSSTSYGWLTTGAIMALGLVGVLALFRFPYQRWVLIGPVVVGLLAGTAVGRTAPPEPARLVKLADATTMPAGWELSSEDVRGNTWCFKGSPQVSRTHRVPDTLEQARNDLVSTFEQ
ncbi:hypothetical protein [Aestuariimicrobium ganziense]|uniref:hypothetical protein n=1 Tax=Aestuariimicrobium ganziense TaxID=2773677 RepID=UPI001945A54A|nr:hypothetical protein [Aestuariimicrobium ganziense]